MNTLHLTSRNNARRKFDRILGTSVGADKKSLKHTNVFHAKYVNTMNPVCPFCGMYNASNIDYSVLPDGRIEYTAVCHNDKTVFRYVRDMI